MLSSAPSTPIIVGVTGLPASGKNTFGEIAKEQGFVVCVMGDVVRAECIRQGLEVNRENSNKVMVDLRLKYGKDAIAVKSAEMIKNMLDQGHDKILIDGIRSKFEVEYFQQNFESVEVIGIHASPRDRYERVQNRARLDDSQTFEQFSKRDKIELNVGIGDVIARADFLIVSPNTVEKAEEHYRSFLDHYLEVKGN